MRYLLTGASGFIGRRLAKHLTDRGQTVTALVRKTSVRGDLEAMGVGFAVGDLNSGEGLEAAVQGVDCVLHLAGVTKALTHDEYHRCNADGTRRLAAAMSQQETPPRLVYCSSLAAAGPATVGHPKREEDAPTPISIYGRSKLGGELAVREFAERVPSVIVRPPIVYGPADREFLPSVLPMARFGVILKSGFGPKRYSIIHVDDLCEALIAASQRGQTVSAEDPAAGVYFVDDGREYSWEEMCQLIGQAMGKRRMRVLPLPNVVSFAAGYGSELQAKLRGVVPIMNRDKARELTQEAWTCRSDRAQNELAYRPTLPLDKGLPATIAWYRQEGWL
jgi:nucleoside-diphosphate-sugar epimerase